MDVPLISSNPMVRKEKTRTTPLFERHVSSFVVGQSMEVAHWSVSICFTTRPTNARPVPGLLAHISHVNLRLERLLPFLFS